MRLHATSIAGVMVVQTMRHADERGAFARLYCEDELAPALLRQRIVQVNQSMTSMKGAVRGMHFQHAPHGETKFVRCLRGHAWDVALDLRAGSPTFLQWHAQDLTPDNAAMLVIPRGCAHGFQALEPQTELLYLHTAAYAPQAEDGIDAMDARIAIAWPLPVAQRSERDMRLRRMGDDFQGLAP